MSELGALLPVAMLAILLGALPSAQAESETPPAPLRCYERLYGLKSEQQGGRWQLRLSATELLPYDDGRSKSPELRLTAPDVKDQFASRYERGDLGRESRADYDPGRVRVTALLRALYPSAATSLVSVSWFGAKLRVHRRIAAAVERVVARLTTALQSDPTLRSWLVPPGGGYVYRPIAGTDRLSAHAFGIAIDINAKRSEYWRWQAAAQRDAKKEAPFARPVPAAIVDAFLAEGFIWGGRWYHFDTMHFEYRPELLDPQCYP